MHLRVNGKTALTTGSTGGVSRDIAGGEQAGCPALCASLGTITAIDPGGRGRVNGRRGVRAGPDSSRKSSYAASSRPPDSEMSPSTIGEP